MSRGACPGRDPVLLVLAAVLVAPLALLLPAFRPEPPAPAVLTSADRAAIGEVAEPVPAAHDAVRGRAPFVAELRTRTAAPGAVPRVERWRTRVVLHRGPDGRRRVRSDTAITPDTPDVDD